ncbi:maleate cis-trans isomerase family protein [Nesterenkonia natronophila]|uniref:Maleate cis-trans isomerase n=1 Tax=Nesterenkonia natronophila TaxID=2174932 RepID=A0A3A4F8H2_9MICC|nr:maleate cis-trans isomerase [Nesterenkonia natronophila]RJN32780.1 maleate cis-trans isomerase [Nesterenkonia natronophila]
MSTSVTVGILYPGHAAEDDYPAYEASLLHDGTPPVRLPVTITTIGVDEHTPQALLETGSHPRLVEGAERLLAEHHVDSVMWACTSGSFVYGWEGAREQAQRLATATGLPVSSTSLAFVRAIEELGAQEVAVAASYPHELAAHFREFLLEGGIEVVNFQSQGVFTAAAVGQMARKELFAMIRSVDLPAAQAMVVPDTAMHSLQWIDELEQTLGKPVLTANQVTIWEGMRIAGVKRPQLPALGSLFSP